MGMKDRSEMPEHTQNLLSHLDEQFPSSEKPFGLLSPPADSFGTLEKIDEPVIETPLEAIQEQIPLEQEPAGTVSKEKEPDAPPTWFHQLNSSLEESRLGQEKKAEELQRELKELRQETRQNRQPIVVNQPQQQANPAFDPHALASMGDVAQMQETVQKQLQGLRQAQHQFAMRAEYERAKGAYERVKTRHPGMDKIYTPQSFDDIWSRWTANDPRRSADTDWETEFTTAYKARNHDELQTRIGSLEKELEGLKIKQASVTPAQKEVAAQNKKNLTLVPRPGSTRGVDSPGDNLKQFYKKGVSFKDLGRELLRQNKGAS